MQVITKCDSSSTCRVAPDSPHLVKYAVGAACCAEVEVDVLTGQVMVQRVDLLYDCGDRYVQTLD